MQPSYSIELNIFVQKSNINCSVYPRAVFMTVFALHPDKGHGY